MVAIARRPAPAAENLERIDVFGEQPQEQKLTLVTDGAGSLGDERARGDVMHAPGLLDVLIEELCLARVVNGRWRPVLAAPRAQPDQRLQLGAVVSPAAGGRPV